MLAEHLDRTVQWQGFDGSALSADGRGPEQRVVDRFLRGFDDGEEEW